MTPESPDQRTAERTDFNWSPRHMEGVRNEEQSVDLGRRFRSIGETLYSGVTKRRGEEGNAGSQWKRMRGTGGEDVGERWSRLQQSSWQREGKATGRRKKRLWTQNKETD